MQELARLPNVVVKIGGLGTEATGFNIHLEETRPSSERLAGLWRPYTETCVELFDAEEAFCATETRVLVARTVG